MSNSIKNYSNIKIGILALLLAGGSLQAAELNVADGQGVPYLRVDAADGSKFDLSIQFDNTNVNSAAELSLTDKFGEARTFPVSSTDLTNGLSVQNVSLGEYVISANPSDLKIKTVNVADAKVAKNADASSDDTIGTTAYVVGAAALAGGVAAVSSGSDGMDVFSSGGSNANTAREGELNTSAAFNDPNRPTPPGFGGNAVFVPTPTPFPNRIETPTGGNPPVAPAPPVGNPMTPS